MLSFSLSLESDLNDRSVVFFIFVFILESQERLYQVPVLVLHVFGLSPLFTSLVIGDFPLLVPLPLHDVVPHDVSPGPGLGLLQAEDDHHDDDQEKLGKKHPSAVRV